MDHRPALASKRDRAIPYLSAAALRQGESLDLSLQGPQLLPDPRLPPVQRLLHLLLPAHVLPVALSLHLPDPLLALALQGGQPALEAVQDVSPDGGQPGVQQLLYEGRGAGPRDGPAAGRLQEPLELALMAQYHALEDGWRRRKKRASELEREREV